MAIAAVLVSAVLVLAILILAHHGVILVLVLTHHGVVLVLAGHIAAGGHHLILINAIFIYSSGCGFT